MDKDKNDLLGMVRTLRNALNEFGPDRPEVQAADALLDRGPPRAPDRCPEYSPDVPYGRCKLRAGHIRPHEWEKEPHRCPAMHVSPDGIEHRRCERAVGHGGKHLFLPIDMPTPPVTAETPVPQRLDYLEDREANLAHVVGALEKEHKALVKRLDDVEWNAVARTSLSGIETRLDVAGAAAARSLTANAPGDKLRTIAR